MKMWVQVKSRGTETAPKLYGRFFLLWYSFLQVLKEKIPAHFSLTLILCENRKKGGFFLEKNAFDLLFLIYLKKCI